MPKLQDLSGRSFGDLVVLERATDRIYRNGQRLTMWACRCKCGKTKVFPGIWLRSKKVVSCGCKHIEARMCKLVGRKYGRLTVLGRAPDRYHRPCWVCKCDCGKQTVVFAQHLKSGVTKSCGCLWEEKRLESGMARKKACFRLAKIHASKRSLPFQLSFDEFVKISESPCAYCGVAPYKIQTSPNNYGTWTCNGIDRVNSALGYVPENCAPCCEPCNQGKNSRTVEEFLRHAQRIVEYQSRKTPNDWTI